MKCYICNNTLGVKEIHFNKKSDSFEPCRNCLNIAGSLFRDCPIVIEREGLDGLTLEILEGLEDNE